MTPSPSTGPNNKPKLATALVEVEHSDEHESIGVSDDSSEIVKYSSH